MPRDDITDMSGLIIGPVFNIHFAILLPLLPTFSRSSLTVLA